VRSQPRPVCGKQFGSGRSRESDREIGFATRDVERADAYSQIYLQIRVGLAQCRDHGADQQISQRFGRSHSNRARYERVSSCRGAFDVEGGALHGGALLQYCVSGRSGGKAIRRPV
jgi:hypothetical protein